MSDDKLEIKHDFTNERRLFDGGERTDSGYKRRDESDFDWLNRSAWASAENARKTLESWFARFPEEKKADIRGRFRGDNRQHVGALLELGTHELLRAVGTRVNVDPDFDGKRPDFAVTYKDAPIVVECTVVQESDDDFNATNRIDTIKMAVDSIDTGQFALAWRRLLCGTGQPPTGQLCNDIRNWVSSLNADEGMARCGKIQGTMERDFTFGNGWKLRLGAVPVGSEKPVEEDTGAIGLEVASGGGFRRDDLSLRSAVEKKASKYRSLDSPYLIVVGSGIEFPDFSHMLKALFGRTEPQADLTHKFDGLLGSPTRPRNHHVSAVLYKPRLRNVWTLCGKDDPWQLVLNPWAEYPLPTEALTFATHWVLKSNGLVNIEPSRTLNAILGLPDPWPGWEH